MDKKQINALFRNEKNNHYYLDINCGNDIAKPKSYGIWHKFFKHDT